MKIDNTELAPSGKLRLKIYLNKEELEVMRGLLENAQKYVRHMPITDKTRADFHRVKRMNQEMNAFFSSGKSFDELKNAKKN